MSETEVETLDQWAVKYRPRTVEQLLAPPAQKDEIKQRIKLRDEHAYLISGMFGTGKTTVATLLAHGYTSTPWGTKTADIIEVNCADESKISDVRGLVQASRYLPSKKDGRRVIWLEEVHALTKTSASPLLRAIEDSPKHTMWMLVTNEPFKVLPTLASRCYSIKMDLPHPDDLIRLQLRVLHNENALQSWTKEDRVALCRAITRASGLIPRVALQLLKKATTNAEQYANVKELIESGTINSVEFGTMQAAIKIIMALILRYRGNNSPALQRAIFNSLTNQDGYGLIKSLTWNVDTLFTEGVTGQSMPGTYLYLKEAKSVKALANVPLSECTEPLGLMLESVVAMMQGNRDFSVDPRMILSAGLLKLYREFEVPTQ